MSNNTPAKSPATATPAAFNPDALPALRVAAGRIFAAGRELKNYGQTVERICRDAACAYGNTETKAAELAQLSGEVARMIANAETVADELPALRSLAGATSDKPASVPTIADAGMAIVIQYRCPTNASGARWSARFDRDAETVFKANAGFTFDDKDNEGSDVAALRCLAKFQAYCNEPIPGVIKTSTATRFVLVSRASLGRGAYAYTFRRA
jgi:hypothetical protein